MAALWKALLAFLTWLAADPAGPELEHAKAAGAVAVAYAAAAREPGPPPAPPAPPEPAPQCACGGTCVNGYWKPDGRILQKCPDPATCPCKAKPAAPACPDGKCPPAR
jgi:hypothetical protein